MVMELIVGGELFYQLQLVNSFNKSQTLFYLAQVFVMLKHLHSKGIIYRDLKPENLLIDELGYIKLIDFGLSKIIEQERTKSLCGTPEYFAPEMIMGRSYDFSLDFWTVGILLYELLTGDPPFQHEDPVALQELILEGDVYYGPEFDQETK